MINSKTDTLIYEGLGFPIRLINVPMKKKFGEWVIDINFNHLQIVVLRLLALKLNLLKGAELRFIRHYFEMSTHTFAKLFGVTHAAVLKWENEESKMNFGTEIWIRLYILDHLKVSDKEFRRSYLKLNPETINRTDKIVLLEVDADIIAC